VFRERLVVTVSPYPGLLRNEDQLPRILIPSSQVLRYDDGPLAILNDLSDLEHYVAQNSEMEIQRRREIRIALRALDGQRVHWPYLHVDVSPRPIVSR
jgi:hypothetical protein